MNFLKKYTFYFIILLFFCSCGRSAEEQKRISRAQQDSLRVKDSLALKVAVLPTLDCLPIFVAKDSHLFDTLGVDVHLRFFNAQMDCDTAIAGGGIEGYVTDLVRAQRLSKQGVSLEYVTATNASWQLIANRKARLRSEEHTSELQSRQYLVCRLLLEKKKKNNMKNSYCRKCTANQ